MEKITQHAIVGGKTKQREDFPPQNWLFPSTRSCSLFRYATGGSPPSLPIRWRIINLGFERKATFGMTQCNTRDQIVKRHYSNLP
ncbi:hypothetical protein N7478_002273 [Penicillium angulare]|uniref:uncharacterized protein n=1 Tax=Penicillium angulare TaxID=116970 RepID=UPI002541AA73|nr:uncharacterized protein N7478_002273 [Penicillium angulare]KAJ5286587.1 hypothetical protein N7478_002273 [Penicillium angulare]